MRQQSIDEMDKEQRADKISTRPSLEIRRRYLFREKGTESYFEGRVLGYGGADITGDEGDERFALICLKVDGKRVWRRREEIIIERQHPSDYHDGY